MKGTERGLDGQLRYFYQYKVGGSKFYYKKSDNGKLRLPFQRPYIPRPQYEREEPREERHEYREYVPYVPPTPVSRLEAEFNRMDPNVKTLITRWLLIFGFRKITEISKDAVNKLFRQLSLIHHPDRGGSEDNCKELGAVRDHLITLCAMGDAMN